MGTTVKLAYVAKLLEQIPSKLPFSRHPYRHIVPVDEFSRLDVVIYMTWLFGCFVLGVATVAWYNIMAGVVYLILAPTAYLFYLYLACTKCPYYGKRCYMGGGKCAERFFSPRSGDYTLIEDLMVPALWIAVTVYPMLFLIYFRSWIALLVYSMSVGGWHILHKRNVCSKCLNVRCALNPRFVGRTGRV